MATRLEEVLAIAAKKNSYSLMTRILRNAGQKWMQLFQNCIASRTVDCGSWRHALRIVIVAWIVLLIAVALHPNHTSMILGFQPLNRHWPARARSAHFRHRTVHFTIFGATTCLFLVLGRNRWQQFACAVAVFALGAWIEWAQAFFYRNPFEWADVRDDAIAILLGSVLFQGCLSVWPRLMRREVLDLVVSE
jgi:hypothetical protein